MIRQTEQANEISHAIRALEEISSSIIVRRCHWISTPNGDQGHEWCPDCGRAKVRNLRRRDRRRRNDYILDGGWRTDHDGTCVCAGCGSRLEGSLSEFGAEAELDHYLEHPPEAGDKHAAIDLSEILIALECCLDSRVEMAADAISVAMKFISESTIH